MMAPDVRLYVIGDIHGRLDLLERMIELVNLDIKQSSGDCLVVTLGDYVDRGPNSRGVLDRLLKNPFAGRYVALRGNHEALLEEFLGNPAIAAQWWRLGGLETLRSFDISVRRWMTNRNFNRAADAIARSAVSRTRAISCLTEDVADRWTLLSMPRRSTSWNSIGATGRNRPVVDPR